VTTHRGWDTQPLPVVDEVARTVTNASGTRTTSPILHRVRPRTEPPRRPVRRLLVGALLVVGLGVLLDVTVLVSTPAVGEQPRIPVAPPRSDAPVAASVIPTTPPPTTAPVPVDRRPTATRNPARSGSTAVTTPGRAGTVPIWPAGTTSPAGSVPGDGVAGGEPGALAPGDVRSPDVSRRNRGSGH